MKFRVLRRFASRMKIPAIYERAGDTRRSGSARANGPGFKITRRDDHQFLWINIFAERGIDLLRREAGYLFLDSALVRHRAPQVAETRERRRQGAIVCPRDLLRL